MTRCPRSTMIDSDIARLEMSGSDFLMLRSICGCEAEWNADWRAGLFNFELKNPILGTQRPVLDNRLLRQLVSVDSNFSDDPGKPWIGAKRFEHRILCEEHHLCRAIF